MKVSKVARSPWGGGLEWQNSDDLSGPPQRILGGWSPEFLTWWREGVQTTRLACFRRP